MFRMETLQGFNEERIEHGSDRLYEALMPTYSPKTRRPHDLGAYVTGFRVVREELMRSTGDHEPYSELEVEACLAVATDTIEDCLDIQQQSALQEQQYDR